MDDIEPPETYDTFLQTLSYASPSDAKPLETAWTIRVFTDSEYSSNMVRKKYKPVDRKVRPVPSYMPDPNRQTFKHVEIPLLPPLSSKVPALSEFVPTERIT